MKKNIVTLIIMLTSFQSMLAQYVTIPDANFRNFLISKYPTCFDEFVMMDTTCIEITKEKLLSVEFQNIKNLEGLQYFDSLTQFYCTYNAITKIPQLHSPLEELDCGYNQLTELTNLPKSLTNLYCRNNQLTELINGTIPCKTIVFFVCL